MFCIMLVSSYSVTNLLAHLRVLGGIEREREEAHFVVHEANPHSIQTQTRVVLDDEIVFEGHMFLSRAKSVTICDKQ